MVIGKVKLQCLEKWRDYTHITLELEEVNRKITLGVLWKYFVPVSTVFIAWYYKPTLA